MKRFFGVLIVGAILGLQTTPDCHAQSKKPSARQSKKPNPIYAPIQDKLRLPRVLLIGDSISVGYTLPTRKRLKGKANVHFTLQGSQYLAEKIAAEIEAKLPTVNP